MDTFIFNDGGRAEAGYKGQTGDCVCRSICIVTGKPYDEVYQALAEGNFTQRKSKHNKKGKRTAANGINTKRKWFNEYMLSLGFKRVPTMFVGVGCKMHLKKEELPTGKIICNVSKHFVAVVDGVINDIYDCSREGTRCVYGYYYQPNK